MIRITIFAATVACLFAQALPVAMTNTVVYVEKPAPLMWNDCSQTMKLEREIACRAQEKSAKVKKL